VAEQPTLIIQVPAGSAIAHRLRDEPPASVTSGSVLVEDGPADEEGKLEPPEVGQVVLSMPSPEGLAREADTVRRVVGGAGTGTEPLVVVLDVAEELRDEELAPLLEAAGHAPRAVILRVIADA
jgi:hypothetical protein